MAVEIGLHIPRSILCTWQLVRKDHEPNTQNGRDAVVADQTKPYLISFEHPPTPDGNSKGMMMRIVRGGRLREIFGFKFESCEHGPHFIPFNESRHFHAAGGKSGLILVTRNYAFTAAM